jgi:aminoglycoside phosphotransferase (APT) family kinase protein
VACGIGSVSRLCERSRDGGDYNSARLGDPHADIGWFAARGWCFARLDREAGGIADPPSYRGYQRESGRFIDPRGSPSEVLASGRWAVIALEQTDRQMIGGEPDLDLAWSGRRMTEDELETLMLLNPAPCPFDK